jgi:hypothetical protein
MTNDQLISFYERSFGPFVHMAPLDKSIWSRFLMQGGATFAPFQYDIRVGDGVELPSNATPMDNRVAQALTTKRIDVLAWVNGHIIIIEVKQRAGLSAIGQLVGYKVLYQKQFPENPGIELWLVTDKLQPDMITPLNAANIRYFEVDR